METNLSYKLIRPDKLLADYIYCYSSLQNLSFSNEAVIIPNGKIDLMFSKTVDSQLRISLLGLETQPKYAKQDVSNFFAVSFNPLAVDYIFRFSIADIVNSGKALPDNFSDFSLEDLNDFDGFCKTVQKAISFYERTMLKRASRMAQESLDSGERMHGKNALSTMLDFFSKR
ncbi:DUF6597 domain-containing transcriptional factor [Spirosoma fluviale]|uniref:DUF6597 domain-containing protein n=1 Tax=Spirosoma fluviale TaxID=1597977 RepID=A0A286FHW4_9BACT|nr:DUF6597 domain-containing transcriptional factor [Spirosoma fluviale]SOD82579.1 hypothetical protein SAMN06269250_2188 [Spirosoma fluviale]